MASLSPSPYLNVAKPSLSTDPDQSFFRAWALRGSEGSGSSKSSANTSPGSPGTVPTQKKPKPIERRGWVQTSLEHIHLDDAHQEVPSIHVVNPSSQSFASRRVGSTSTTSSAKTSARLRLFRRKQQLDERSSNASSEMHLSPIAKTPFPNDRQVSRTEDTPPSPNKVRPAAYRRPSTQLKHFYSRAKNFLKSNTNRSLQNDSGKAERGNSLTGDALDQVSDVLNDHAQKGFTPPSPANSTSNLSIAAICNRRLTGWSRPHKTFTIRSTSSSVHDLHVGRSPPNTPDASAWYTGSDSQQYFRVDMANADAPNFLPSEARRIGTPPLPTANTGKASFHGFFVGFGGLEGSSAPVTPPEERTRANSFELNLPEHLPNSPLCPRNSKHPSGGKGVCVYHGWNHV